MSTGYNIREGSIILADRFSVRVDRCVICGREIEPSTRYYTDAGEPRHMLCEGNEDGLNRDLPPWDNDPRTDDEIKQAVYDAYYRHGEWD